MEQFGWLSAGLALGVGATYWYFIRKMLGSSLAHEGFVDGAVPVTSLLRTHLSPLTTADITVSERRFPFRVRADLQRTIDTMFQEDFTVQHFTGVRKEYSHEEMKLSDCLIESQHNPAVSVPPEYEEVDIGDAQPLPVLKNGL